MHDEAVGLAQRAHRDPPFTAADAGSSLMVMRQNLRAADRRYQHRVQMNAWSLGDPVPTTRDGTFKPRDEWRLESKSWQ